MQVVLMMFRGDKERRSFSITREVTVIGRREDCDFRIPLGEISRKHCRLVKDGEALRIEDLGSSNGTYQNGQRVQSGVLRPGDTMQVGAVTFVVQIDGIPDESEMQPIYAGDRPTSLNQSDANDSAAKHATTQPGNHDSRHDADLSDDRESGEFDPMSILESEASDALPTFEDSGAAGEDMMLDVEDSAAPKQE